MTLCIFQLYSLWVLCLAHDPTGRYTTPCTQWAPKKLLGLSGTLWKRKTCRMSLLHVKPKLPERISLNIVTSPPGPFTTILGISYPHFWHKKAKERSNSCGRLYFNFYCSHYIFRAYLLCSNHWHIYSSSSYLTYFSLCSISMVCIKHMFLGSRNGLFKHPGALYLQFW